MADAVRPVRSGHRVSVGATRKRKFGSPIDKAKAHEVAWRQAAGFFEAARNYVDLSFVYLIGEVDDGHVKIGISKDPVARLRTMQTGNPRRLRIEYVLAGDMNTERLLQEMWEPYAVLSATATGKVDVNPGTEWFLPRIRADLFPIIETAAEQQALALLADDEPSVEDLERILRLAHHAHGYVPVRREETRVLASGVGYVVTRRSRI